ncbi:hypothetical protein [Acetonema longum]|uniref:Uncharacterized protein n=1 Tax=Acetonema longum DSM 6540 TaxID=1009370 RepID=F7NJF8_9FIRM|nr:hypothetical protein [Acetonema longum]EGO63827.1 hypothetical protein ALO_11069 [Acetonema longum DSM 6540]
MLGGMMTGSMAVTIATEVGDNALDGKELITPDVMLAALVSSKLKLEVLLRGRLILLRDYELLSKLEYQLMTLQEFKMPQAVPIKKLLLWAVEQTELLL